MFSVGGEPDPRFSLANERTFLSWVRTALALMLAGVALEALDAPIQGGWRLAAALIFVALGLVGSVHAWVSWASTEKAIRVSRPLPGMSIGGVIAIGSSLAIIAIIIGSVLT